MESDLNLHISGILLAYGVLMMGILSPGPAVLAIIGTSMDRGRRPALALAFGVACGSVTWGILAASGMASILAASVTALFLIKVAGGLYLLWLAFKSLRAALKPDDPSRLDASKRLERSSSQLWFAGLLLHLTNPKAVLAWIATVALGMTASSPWWVGFLIVAGGAVISTVGNCAYAILFSSAPVMRFYQRMHRPISGLFAFVFGAAGLRLITDRS